MHSKWKNYLTEWTDSYAGHKESPKIILEVLANYDIQIWHDYFGLSGTNNDINMLESSHIFNDLTQFIAPLAHYFVRGLQGGRKFHGTRWTILCIKYKEQSW